MSKGASLQDLEQWLREGSDEDDFDPLGVTEEHLRSLCSRPCKDVLGTWLESDAPEKLLAKPPDIRSTKKVEPVKATTEEEEPDPDAVDAKASMADEADDVPKKREAVFLDIKTFEMIMMILEGFSFSKAAAEFGYSKSQLRKKILKLKHKHIQNTKVSVDILADSNLK